MSEDSADLHIHTSYSDGLHSPSEVARMAAAAGLRWFAITDHDTVEGLPEARQESERLGIGFVPGVELSVDYRDQDVHFLGYWIDPGHPGLNRLLEEAGHSRAVRAKAIVQRLHALGVPLEYERVLACANREGSLGRPHVARALIEGGWVSTFPEAFARYLRCGGPAYVPKLRLEPERAVRVLRDAGGAVVLAHPGAYRPTGAWRGLLKLGFTGIETEHPTHTIEQASALRRAAARRGLAATGGSDFHGKGLSDVPIGGLRVDARVVAALAERKETSA